MSPGEGALVTWVLDSPEEPLEEDTVPEVPGWHHFTANEGFCLERALLEGQMEGLAMGTVSFIPTKDSEPLQGRSTQSTLCDCIIPRRMASITNAVRTFGAACISSRNFYSYHCSLL